MNRLETALQRLYGWSATADAPPLRALLLVFRRSRDWPQIATLLHIAHEDLDLPAPAVSVSAESGFTVWFALASPVTAEDGHAFLETLMGLSLPGMPESDVTLWACPAPASLQTIPALSDKSGRWSAFIDPGMGSLFADEAGLDFAPPLDRQADLLSGLAGIDADAFARVLAKSMASQPGPLVPNHAPDDVGPVTGLIGPFAGPREFLLAVMNEPGVPLAQRIEAAIALLPGSD